MSLAHRQSSCLNGRAGRACAAVTPRTRLGKCRSSHIESGPFSLDDGAFNVLMSRVQGLRAREERAALRARIVESLRAARPILPENVAHQELELDHKLICDWHESSWARLATSTTESDDD